MKRCGLLSKMAVVLFSTLLALWIGYGVLKDRLPCRPCEGGDPHPAAVTNPRMDPPAPIRVEVGPSPIPSARTTESMPADVKAETEAPPFVPGERLVILRAGADIDRLAQRLGAEVTGRIDTLGAYRLRFPNEPTARTADARLAAMREVEAAALNHLFDRPPGPLWTGYPALAPSPGIRVDPDAGEWLIIGLLDAGAPSDSGEAAALLLHPMSLSDGELPTPTPPDTPGHAGAVAASMMDGLQAALGDATVTRVRILPVDIFGDAETTTSFHVTQGIMAAVENGARIINLSLGGDEPAGFVEALIRSAYAQGVVFVGAAGNERTDQAVYPAAYPEVLAVTALDDDGAVLPDAKAAGFVDVAAPGMVLFVHDETWYWARGTSVSTGYISGAIAGLADRLDLSAPEAEAAVRALFAVPDTSD